MADPDRRAERQFLNELLAATLAGRVAWTGTIRPGCWQFVAGDYLVAVDGDGGEPAIALHHVSGYELETLRASQFADEDEGDEVPALFGDIVAAARAHALGLRRRWRLLGRQIAAANTNRQGPPGA
jgi:hypothetical protein